MWNETSYMGGATGGLLGQDTDMASLSWAYDWNFFMYVGFKEFNIFTEVIFMVGSIQNLGT